MRVITLVDAIHLMERKPALARCDLFIFQWLRLGKVGDSGNSGRALYTIANKLSATPAQVALAWCLARPSITAPIASATNLDQLSDLMASVELQLDDASIDLLNQASAPAAAPASAS
jgi:aryl-alcohol dehydrogenase-like predicted oxidoreductase